MSAKTILINYYKTFPLVNEPPKLVSPTNKLAITNQQIKICY